MPEESRARGGRLRRTLHRLTADTSELDAETMQQETRVEGATPVVACSNRAVVRVFGTLQTVTLRPRAGAPTLEAALFDGSGTVNLIWLGRRRISGIEPGRRLAVEGRLTIYGGRRTIFNPRYELRL